MKTLLYSAASLVFAVSAIAQSATPKVIKKPVPVSPLTIPASAVKQPDGNFRYVDPKGIAWIYRNTPFGVSRATEASVQAQAAAGSQAPADPAAMKSEQDRDEKVTAVAMGDAIQFTRPTPFGVTRWSRSKADLTPDEQKIWEREQAKRNQ